jgi:hypothetical protein
MPWVDPPQLCTQRVHNLGVVEDLGTIAESGGQLSTQRADNLASSTRHLRLSAWTRQGCVSRAWVVTSNASDDGSPGLLVGAILGAMATLRGHVESGRIVVDEPIDLPDGTEVEIAVADDDDMTPEERAEIEASIDRGLEQAARGEMITADELLRRLKAT